MTARAWIALAADSTLWGMPDLSIITHVAPVVAVALGVRDRRPQADNAAARRASAAVYACSGGRP